MGTWGRLMAILMGLSVAVLLIVLLSLSPLTKGKQVMRGPVVEITAKASDVKTEAKPVSVGDPPLVIASLPQELTPPARTSVAADDIKVVTNAPVDLPVVKTAPAPAPVAVAKPKKASVAKSVEKPKPKHSLVSSVKRWFDGIFETQR